MPCEKQEAPCEGMADWQWPTEVQYTEDVAVVKELTLGKACQPQTHIQHARY